MAANQPIWKVGVLGATGYIGTPYRRELRACEGVKIVALAARRRDLLETAAAEDGASLISDDWREVVAHPEVNVVIVATPDACHYEAVMACAEAGKHVLCEKPVGLNVREARAMAEAYAARPSLGHFVPFWVRYAEAMQRAKAMVAAGDLGEVRGVVYRWHNPRPMHMPRTWRDDPQISSSGSIADVGSHAYDTVRWIMGDNAKRVLVHGATLSPRVDHGDVNLIEALRLGEECQEGTPATSGTVDYASIAWEFDSGAVGTLVLSHAPYFRRRMAPELELHGTEGSLSVCRLSGALRLASGSNQPEVVAVLPDEGTANRFQSYVFPALSRVVAGEPSEHPTLDDGLAVQAFTDAAASSVQDGHWVEVATPTVYRTTPTGRIQ